MWRLRSLLVVSALLMVSGQDDADTEAFEALMQEEALKVLRERMDEMAQIPQPPDFNLPPDFMRSFMPGTGVGNREELIIDSIREIPVHDESNFLRWQYKRFNNTDYILGVDERKVVLKAIDSNNVDYFAFSGNPILSIMTNPWSAVRDVAMFTRFEKRSAVLFVAILIESAQTSIVNIYEILGKRSVQVTLIDLGISQSKGPFAARKLSYVQSQYGESLVILIRSPDVAQVVHQQKGSSDLNHYIAVYYPSAVDVVSFTIHGHGYIAVANSTNCGVYKLDEFAKGHLLFDSLPILRGDLIDLEYFRLGFHHYLAVSGRSEQYLYVWKSGEFALKQAFKASGVNQLYSSMLPTCRDDVILLLIADGTVEIFMYSGKNDLFVPSNAVVPPTFRILPGTVASFSQKNKAVLIFLSDDRMPKSFVIETSLQTASNPVLVATRNIGTYMKGIQDMLQEHAKQVQDIHAVVSNAVRTTGDQHITAYQVFEKLQSTKQTVVSQLKEAIYVEWEGSELTLEEYRKGTDLLQRNIEDLERLVEEIAKVIPDVVRVDEETVITGTKRFTGDVSGASVLALSVNLQSAAGVNIPQLQKEIYRLDKPQLIKGTLTFEKPLTITGNLDVTETINGIDIVKDVMTTNTKQTSYASMFFKNRLAVQGDLFLSGKLNGIDIGNEVVTLSGTHNITGKKIFHNGIIAENVETLLLDGMDINDVYNKAFTKSGNQEVPGTKNFNGGLLTNDIVLHGHLNGYNITELAGNIVRVDRPELISGHKTFLEDVTMHNTLTVGGTVNGLRIPEDLFLTDVVQNVTGAKVFSSRVTADNVFVKGTVDSLNIPGDIVTLTGDEEVTGTLVFTEGINVENDITVEGFVDGVDIEAVAKSALKLNETSTFKNAVFLGPVTVTDNLVVNGLVNRVNISDIAKNVIYKDETDIVIDSPKTFKKVVADKVKLERMINGYNLSVDFMRVHGDQVINGIKTFKQPVTFKSLNIGDGNIGNLNINQLYGNRLTLVIEDKIVQDIDFEDHVIVEGDLIVHGRIGGLKIPEDIVLKSSTNPISNKVFTNRVLVDNLIVNGNANVAGSFGGVDLVRFYNDRITLNGAQEIEGDVWIGQSSIENLELSGLLNGIDFTEFAGNVMSKTKNQEVRAAKNFTGKTTVLGPITTEEGVNGVNLAAVNARAFRLDRDNYVIEPFQFEDVTVNDITVSGVVNDVNITRLAEDSLKKRGGVQHVTGANVFEAGFHVDGDIIAGTVNDLVIPEHVLLKDTPQTVTGRFTLKSLNVGNDLHVAGLVNGLDLSDIAPRLARTDIETIIESNVTFAGPVRISQDVEVTGLVNGIDMKRISESILLREGDQRIKGNKVLRGNVTVRGDVDVGFVNGLDWRAFLADVVRTDVPQRIQSPKTFSMDTEVNNFSTNEARVGLVNGRSLEDFVNEAVFIDIPANITGQKVFRRDVEITGDLNAELINGLNLKTDVITLKCNDASPQIITGQKSFENVTSYGDVIVAGTVNSYNLYDLYKDTLLVDRNQTVFGKKTVLPKATFLGDVYSDTVNGLKLQRDLITLDTDQTIFGPLVFNEDVFVEKDLYVHGLVNEVDIIKLAEEAVYLDTNDTIEGSYNLQTAIVTSDVAVGGLVNGIDLPAFDRNVSAFWDEAVHSLVAMDTHSRDNCKTAKYLQNVLSGLYYALDGFVFYQDLRSPASYIDVKSSDAISLIYLDDLVVDSRAVLSVWDSTTKSFLSIDNQPSLIAQTLTHSFGNNELSINIGIQEKDSYVSYNDSPLNVATGFQNAAILMKGLNEIVIALLFPPRGVCELYKISKNLTTNGLVVENFGVVSVGKESTSIAMFEINSGTYMAVSRLHNPPYVKGFSKIYVKVNDVWEHIQSISVAASTYVKHFLYHGYHYLVFTNTAPVHETREPKSIMIYRNSGPNQQFFNLFQKVNFDDAKGLATFEYGDLSELYLATWNDTRIQVFRLEGESGFTTSFTIHGRCIKDVKVLELNEDIYLAVGQQDLRDGQPVSSVLYRGLTQGAKYSPYKFKHC